MAMRGFVFRALQMAKWDVWDARDVGQWLLEIGFESFAMYLATREGQRPRCPYGGESGSGDAAPPGGFCASRLADGEVGRVGQWFLEICFEGFAQDLATPSARSFAHESESQNTK